MTDLTRYEEALRNADAAGDTQAATTIAAEIRRLQSAGTPVEGSPAEQPAAQSQPAPEQSYAAGIGQQALQGATLGWAPTLQSYIAGLAANSGKIPSPFGDEMDPRASIDAADRMAAQPPPIPLQEPTFAEQRREALDSIKAQMGAFSKENPKASLAANIAGGIATGGGVLSATKAVGIPSAGMKGMAATGGAIGAVAGAGSANQGEEIEGALKGLGLGVVGGAVVSGMGSGLGALWRKFAPGVRDRIGELSKASGMTPAEVQTRLKALGPKATLADVDAVFQRAGDVAASRLGPNAKRVQELIRRDETQLDRLLQPIQQTLGGSGAAVRTAGQLKDIRMREASPLYEAAFNRGVNITNRMRDLLSRPETQKAWRASQSIEKSDPALDPQFLVNGADPSFRGWQAITERLWDRASALERGGQTKFANTIKDLRNAILKELDDQNPEFQKARGLWAGTKQADDMLEEGAKFLKASPSEVAEKVAQMSDADKAFYRMGIGRALEERLASVADTSDATRMLRNEAFRLKVYEAFPDKESAVNFINTIRAEAIKKNTTNMVGRGSQTQPRQVAEKQLGGASINPGDMSKSNIFSRVLGGLSAPREKTIQDIGELLLSQDPTSQARAVALMGQSRAKILGMGPAGAATANLAGQRGQRKSR